MAKDEMAMTMATTGKKGRFHFGYLVVLTLVMTSFCPLSLGLSCAGIFYPPLSAELGVGKGVLSYYTSVLWLAAFISLPLLGRMLAKKDARVCLAGAVLIIMVAFVWLSFTASLWQFYVGAFLMGIGIAMLLFLAPSTLINRWFDKRSGFLLGVVMAFTGVGGVVWNAAGGVLINSIGWSGTYLVFAAISAVTLPFTILCTASRPADKGLEPYGHADEPRTDLQGAGAQAPSASVGGISSAEAFKMPLFYLIFFMCLFLNFGMYVYFMIPSYASTLSISATMPLLGAIASSVAMAGQTISKVVLGYIGDRHPHISTIIGIILGIVGVTLFAVGGGSTALIFVAAFAFGFFYGITNVMTPILCRGAFGDTDYARIYSRISLAAAIGSMVSGFIWGALIDIFDTFMVMFVGVALTMLVTCILVLAIRRSERVSRQAHRPVSCTD